jgi:multidrug efflux system membrane fusion protein
VPIGAARGPTRPLSFLRGLAYTVALLALLAGCKRENAYVPPPPPQVGVAKPLARTVTPALEATGSTAAYNAADLVARIEGFVQSIDYKDGAAVKAGQPLFVIEPAPYEAKLQQAQSAVTSAQAQYAQTEAEFRRQASLGRSDFASRSTVEQAQAARDSNLANLQNQQAGVSLAQINLGYTRVLAPFDGVVTQHLVSVGALVGASGPTKLASIVQLDPIYVNFTVSEKDVQRIRADLVKDELTLADLGKITVEVGLMTEQGYPHSGVLDYAEPQVDSTTGTLTLRAVLANKDRALLPGYFVRVRIPQSRMAAPALLVPDTAISTSQAGPYVLVVDKDNIVQQRSVRTGQLVGALRVIEEGIGADDQVILTGLTRAIPGEKVAPVPAPLPAS